MQNLIDAIEEVIGQKHNAMEGCHPDERTAVGYDFDRLRELTDALILLYGDNPAK
jgi:hypothetical protein